MKGNAMSTLRLLIDIEIDDGDEGGAAAIALIQTGDEDQSLVLMPDDDTEFLVSNIFIVKVV